MFLFLKIFQFLHEFSFLELVKFFEFLKSLFMHDSAFFKFKIGIFPQWSNFLFKLEFLSFKLLFSRGIELMFFFYSFLKLIVFYAKSF